MLVVPAFDDTLSLPRRAAEIVIGRLCCTSLVLAASAVLLFVPRFFRP